MLTAKTKQGRMITLAVLKKKMIDEARKETFYCPTCNEMVILKAGKHVIPHFAHRGKSSCVNNKGESIYHQQGKLVLFNWLKKQGIHAELEYYIPEIKQRPDLFFMIGDQKVAIEFQCVKISVEEVRKRNNGYAKMNITPIWILGAKLFDRVTSNIVKTEKFMHHMIHQYTDSSPTFLYYLCPTEEKLTILQHIYLLKTNVVYADIYMYSTQEIDLRHMFAGRQLQTNNFYKMWQNEKKRFRLFRQTVYGRELTWENSLYERKLHRQNLPSLIYMPIQLQMLMKKPTWDWQSKIMINFMEDLNIGDFFTEEEVMWFLRHDIYKREFFPLLKSGTHPVREYLHILCYFKFIEKVREGVFAKKHQTTYYNQIEAAREGDDEVLKRFMYNKKYEK